jgi:hypothetical protein
MADMKDRAREYLRSQTQLNGGGLFHCNILNLILGFAEQETKALETQIEEMKLCQNCKFEDNDYLAQPCCDCSRCLGSIKRKGNSDKWEIKEK